MNMNEMMEFDRWYEKNDLWYRFIKIPDGGTDVFIRGDIHPLHEFIYQLWKLYYGEEPDPKYFIEHAEILDKVLKTGRARSGDVIGFKNDRIRDIIRLDDLVAESPENPFYGSKNHLEIRHNEQYGGEYPANPVLSSRSDMMEKVLEALNNMRPKEQQIIYDLIRTES